MENHGKYCTWYASGVRDGALLYRRSQLSSVVVVLLEGPLTTFRYPTQIVDALESRSESLFFFPHIPNPHGTASNPNLLGCSLLRSPGKCFSGVADFFFFCTQKPSHARKGRPSWGPKAWLLRGVNRHRWLLAVCLRRGGGVGYLCCVCVPFVFDKSVPSKFLAYAMVSVLVLILVLGLAFSGPVS